MPTYTHLLPPSTYVPVGDLIFRVFPISDPHKFRKFLLLWKFPSCSLFLFRLFPPYSPSGSPVSPQVGHFHNPLWFSSLSLSPSEICVFKGGSMFAYLFRYGSEILIFSFCFFCRFVCKTGQRHWRLGWVTKGGGALDPGSKDWEGRSQRQSTAGPGTPGVDSATAPRACALGLTMAESAG